MFEPGKVVIAADCVLKGDIRNAALVEIAGYIVGNVEAAEVRILAGGRLLGRLSAERATIAGALRGVATVRALLSIANTGSVQGTVRYGRLQLAAGGDLWAEMRNLPPTLSGDFSMMVRRGGATRLTTEDVAAFDPDNAAAELQFTVSNIRSGHIVRASAPRQAIAAFSQAEVEAGSISFQHDGTAAGTAGFDVVVADLAGATAGPPRTVAIAVTDVAALG